MRMRWGWGREWQMACDVVQPISSSAALLAPPHRAHTRRTLINCVFLLQEQLPTTARGEQEREALTRICTEKLSDTATIMSQQVINEQFLADIVSLISSHVGGQIIDWTRITVSVTRRLTYCTRCVDHLWQHRTECTAHERRRVKKWECSLSV